MRERRLPWPWQRFTRSSLGRTSAAASSRPSRSRRVIVTCTERVLQRCPLQSIVLTRAVRVVEYVERGHFRGGSVPEAAVRARPDQAGRHRRASPIGRCSVIRPSDNHAFSAFMEPILAGGLLVGAATAPPRVPEASSSTASPATALWSLLVRRQRYVAIGRRRPFARRRLRRGGGRRRDSRSGRE